jgi:hypothetical protein
MKQDPVDFNTAIIFIPVKLLFNIKMKVNIRTSRRLVEEGQEALFAPHSLVKGGDRPVRG